MNETVLYLDAIEAALHAGREILKIYNSDFDVEMKSDDSPLTAADRRSHAMIKAALAGHGLPAISEEGRHLPYQERQTWEKLWVIDPLDGTKEFIKRNGEFTVNIALVEKRQPVFGVVFAPVPRVLYFAARNLGSFKIRTADDVLIGLQAGPDPVSRMDGLIQSADRLPLPSSPGKPYTIVGSRSHATQELTDFVEQMKKEKGRVDFVQAGSSLKICLVAEGTADIYPRLGPTMEWDTAAGQAVAAFAGARLYDYQTREPLDYNKPDLLNPWFVVERPNTG